MRRGILGVGRWGFLFVGLTALSCQSAPKRPTHTDWADITLYATGFGALRDLSPRERILGVQRAKQDAARQLEEQILALQTDSAQPLSERIKKRDLYASMARYVRGAEVVSVEQKAGGVEVRTRLYLGDHFKTTLGLLPLKEFSPPPRDFQRTF